MNQILQNIPIAVETIGFITLVSGAVVAILWRILSQQDDRVQELNERNINALERRVHNLEEEKESLAEERKQLKSEIQKLRNEIQQLREENKKLEEYLQGRDKDTLEFRKALLDAAKVVNTANSQAVTNFEVSTDVRDLIKSHMEEAQEFRKQHAEKLEALLSELNRHNQAIEKKLP